MSAQDNLLDQVRAAIASRQPLRIRGSGSKDFLAQSLTGQVLDTRQLRGIINYEPSELVITVQAGTPLADIETALAEQDQMFGFEPPHFGPEATIGGCIAAGLSGPRRATAGAVRDFILGLHIIDGHGELLRFGGQVMKNVAGFDVSRLMTGAWGTLGVLLNISIKTVPRPANEKTIYLEMNANAAVHAMNEFAGKPLPISATLWHDGKLMLRLSGANGAVRAAQQTLGGELLAEDAAKDLWSKVREHSHPFFDRNTVIWRLGLPSTAQLHGISGDQLIEWSGAQRWIKTDMPAADLRLAVARMGGHASAFYGRLPDVCVFHTLPPALLALHKKLKKSFDPDGIFNPGRMYAEL